MATKSKPKKQQKKIGNKIDKDQYYKEIDNLYWEVSKRFNDIEDDIFAAQDSIGYSNLKQSNKTALIKKFQLLWSVMNEIVDDIGRLGKVR